MSFLDISTSTPETTSVKRGDYNLATSTVKTFNKNTGTDTKIRRGYALKRTDLVTPNVFEVTTAKEGGAVIISGLPFAYVPTNVNVTNLADGTGEDISATDDDVAIQGITKSGSVVVKMSGTGQPGQEVMTAANGEFAAYDGTGVEYKKGVFLGLPGTQGGNVIKQGWTNGVLGVIEFNGGGV